MGGYSSLNHLEPLKWVPLLTKEEYYINIAGFRLNNGSLVEGSDYVKLAFIDSGTTFSYFPAKLL